MSGAQTVWPLDQLTDLLARCEAADKPNDLLDAELWGIGGMPPDDLKYTASIDAAVAFVGATLPRYRFWVGNWQGTGAVLSPDRNNDQRADAATPALSIICAALKAIIALRTQPEMSEQDLPEGYTVEYGSYRSWHAYYRSRRISAWGYRADAIKACWEHSRQSESAA